MSQRISVVINTYNEAKNIERAIKSVKWADEIVVCDMYSEDQTVEIAKKLGAKVVFHKKTGYVEPARNFAISKASNEWILVLDADEEIPQELAEKLKGLVAEDKVSFVLLPRQNIIFGKWMKASFWWPDYNIRFFRKGSVSWDDAIHSKPQTSGNGLTLPEEKGFAIIHYNYDSITQFVERMNRYTTIQAEELNKKGEIFSWPNLVSKPLGEFLGRFFANQGFKDGLHGLALSLLQSFSFLLVYLKLWEIEKFKEQEIDLKELRQVSGKAGKEIKYWFIQSTLSKHPVKRLVQKVKNKF